MRQFIEIAVDLDFDGGEVIEGDLGAQAEVNVIGFVHSTNIIRSQQLNHGFIVL
jgi:hypothetical protein